MHLLSGCCRRAGCTQHPQFETRSRQHKRCRSIKTSKSPRGGAMYYVIDDKMCVICFRVVDMPRPRVSWDRQLCANCREPIWVAKEWPAEPDKICTHCMVNHKTGRLSN